MISLHGLRRALLLSLLSTLCFAQSVPNGGLTQGQTWTPAQWITAWTSKADVAAGILASPVLNSPTINTPTINSPTFNITGLIQCLHVNTLGVVTGTGSDCGAGSGSSAWSSLTSGTNTTFAALVGTGASLAPTGSGLITANAFSGSLQIANGGTGATTATAALTALLPSQGSYSGDCLGTNGTVASWISCGSGGGGSGTVNSGTTNQVAYYAANGTVVSGATLGGNLIISGGNLVASQAINAQTGTTYTFVTADGGKLVTFSNASAVAVTLPQAGTTGFTTGYSVDVQNKGVGTVTITPTTSTINGAATLVIAQNLGCTITSDNTNYQVSACSAIASSAGTSGTFTGTLTGMASTTTGTLNYVITGNIAIIYAASAITGTSNSTSMTITGVPSQLQPVNQTTWSNGQIIDSGNYLVGAASISGSTITLGLYASGIVTNRIELAPSGFTNSGTKGLPAGFAVSYPLQ